MSRTTSQNSRFALVTSFVLVAAVLPAGCGVNVHSSAVRGMGYVRVDAVVKAHPLYPQLSQLDDAIAAINLSAAAPRVPLSGSQIAAQTRILNGELRAAQDRANRILAQKQTEYAGRERQAVVQAMKAAGVSGSALAAMQLNATSATQTHQAVAAANQDFQAYQQSVVSAGNAATNAVARQLQIQESQKLRAKAEQLQQSETDASLKASQADASQRLAIRTRLSNLAMDESTRTSLQNQLAALNAKEAGALEAQRKADAATMQAYRNQLDAQTGAQVRSQVSSMQGQTQAKLLERRNEVGAQLRNMGSPSVPAAIPPNVKTQIAGIHRTFTAQFQAEAQKTVADYNATKADLDRQFEALHGADVGATGAAATELAALQKRRAALYGQIVDQVSRETSRIAKERGFSIVFDNVNAAAGGYDLTNDLIKDVESQHE
jgi:Outer membrane protein (OmpH-like)